MYLLLQPIANLLLHTTYDNVITIIETTQKTLIYLYILYHIILKKCN